MTFSKEINLQLSLRCIQKNDKLWCMNIGINAWSSIKSLVKDKGVSGGDSYALFFNESTKREEFGAYKLNYFIPQGLVLLNT